MGVFSRIVGSSPRHPSGVVQKVGLEVLELVLRKPSHPFSEAKKIKRLASYQKAGSESKQVSLLLSKTQHKSIETVLGTLPIPKHQIVLGCATSVIRQEKHARRWRRLSIGA
ncbi:hypothetical protein HYQ44_005677 [Verticillium longisporum]|nr:hypothetical protein HYQ44_005677 [Verticillium longisporum]